MIFVQNCCCSVVLLTDFDWLNRETDEADKVLIEKIDKWVIITIIKLLIIIISEMEMGKYYMSLDL